MEDRKLIDGLNIINKRKPESVINYNFHAEHDQLWYGEYDWTNDEDNKILEAWGWFKDEDSWSCYT